MDENICFANGNIKRMQQWGLKLNSSSQIDDLGYTYIANSNKLLAVTEANLGTTDNKLGDFTDKNTTNNYYSYDPNGNLNLDKNKNISSITYNYLNLPQEITVTGKGTITYTYDAAGNKLRKQVSETGQPVKTTLYLGGSVYENDQLQFIGHEEGRIRFRPAAGTTPAGFEYDYFIKDHLGNVRMVLTEEQKADAYPPASMETAQATTEEALYGNIPTTKAAKPAGYPTDNYTNPNDYAAKVKSAAGSQAIGPNITLKVMAGDSYNIRVSSWYKTGGTTPGTPVNPITDLLSALSGSVGAITSNHGGVTATELLNNNVFTPGVTDFLNNQFYTSSKPKAFLNWILFDEQFKYVSGGSGAEQVGGNEEFKIHVKTNLPITKSGYLYVYVSNETANIDVYFDNLQVTHTRGAVLEESHYYPFGLIQAGISSKALGFGGAENDKKYQGYEYNTAFDINLYETFYRTHDPQLGRFWQLDPKPTESSSLYAAMENNPISKTDLLGDTTSYYTSDGKFWFTSNDKLKNSTVVISAEKEEAFFRHFYDNYAFVPDDKRDINAMNTDLRTFGTGYDIASFENFYAENGKSVAAKSVDGVLTEGMSNIELNGKPGKLYAEVQGNLVMKDGMVGVGKEKQSAGDMTHAFPSDLPGENGKVGHIHTHPVAVPTVLSYRKGNFYSGGNFPTHGPSGADQTHAGDKKNGVRNVVVDSKNVYLINGNSSQTIKIPRRQ